MNIKIKGKTLEINHISICAKCSDLCYSELKSTDGSVLAEHDGYVPALMPDEHYGDYVILDIELESGKILNWKKPTQKQVKKTDWELPSHPHK